jgi:mono/diheme cytochrome c family protein
MNPVQKIDRMPLPCSLSALALFIFVLCNGGNAVAEETDFGLKNSENKSRNIITLVQHRGPPEGRGPRHGGRGKHCPEMDFEKGCTGGKGMRHRGGMGMHHGGGQGGTAQCPQSRATVKAPDEFYNLVNPIENTPDNIEKGRLLFSVDVQPTCVMCHGNKGDGTGGFGADMSPKPRNFTCTEMMKDIPDGQLFWVIQNGSPETGMPPFQGLQDEQIWQILLYVRQLAQ